MTQSPTRARTYQLSQENITRINALAAKLDAHPSRLVNMLLTRGLAEIEAGHWHLGREPLIYRPYWRDNAAKTPQE